MRHLPFPSVTPSAPTDGRAPRKFLSFPETSSSTKHLFERRSSSRLHSCTIMPSRMMTTSSQTCSTSRRRCEHMSTFMPCSSFISRTRRSMRRRAEGSKSVGRLIKDNQFRTVNDGLGQLGHLLHSQRIGSQFAIARFTKPHVKQCLVRLFEGNRLRQAGQLGHQAQE